MCREAAREQGRTRWWVEATQRTRTREGSGEAVVRMVLLWVTRVRGGNQEVAIEAARRTCVRAGSSGLRVSQAVGFIAIYRVIPSGRHFLIVNS